MNNQVRIRQGDAKKYLFEMDEKKEKAIQKEYNILDIATQMREEDLDDFLGPPDSDERKALKVAREQRQLYECRDLCKEMKEKEESEKRLKEEKLKLLEERNQILEEQARKHENDFRLFQKETDTMLSDQNQKIEKLTTLLSQLLKN